MGVPEQKTNRNILSADGAAIPFESIFHFMGVGLTRAAADANGDIEFDVLSNIDGLGFDPMQGIQSPPASIGYVIICLGSQNVATIGAPVSFGTYHPRMYDPFNQFAGIINYIKCMFSSGPGGVTGLRSSGIIARIVDSIPNGWELALPASGIMVQNPRKISLSWTKVGAGLNVAVHLLIFGKRDP